MNTHIGLIALANLNVSGYAVKLASDMFKYAYNHFRYRKLKLLLSTYPLNVQ